MQVPARRTLPGVDYQRLDEWGYGEFIYVYDKSLKKAFVADSFVVMWGRLREIYSHDALEFIHKWHAPCGMRINLRNLDDFTRRTLAVGAKISPLTLRLHVWCEVYRHDSDVVFIISGISEGFDWIKRRPTRAFNNSNHVAPEYFARVDVRLKEMMEQGELVRVPRSSVYCVSGVLAVSKDNGSDIRVCHNLASPEGDSVNDNQDVDPISFVGVNYALALTRPGGWMAKVDLKSAYRHVACHPSWWELHGLQWPSESGRFYIDVRLPFGSKGAVACFQRLSEALARYVARRIPLAPYLDDFYLSSLLRAACSAGYFFLIGTLESLGWTVNKKKCVGPSQSIIFLGVGVTTMYGGVPSMAVYLDEERLVRIRSQCLRVAQAPGGRVPRSMLESLLGHLTFAAMVLRDARCFTRVGYAVLRQTARAGLHSAPVPTNLKVELQQWCKTNNGVYYSRSVDMKPAYTAHGSWDASTRHGMGGYLLGDTFSFTWVEFIKEFSGKQWRPCFPKFDSTGKPVSSIAFLELFAGYFWLRRFGKRVAGHTVTVHCDNTAACGMLRKLWGTVEFTPLIKQIRLMCIRWRIELDVVWIKSKDNAISDRLSRDDWVGYLAELDACKKREVVERDLMDWQLDPVVVRELDQQFGPFLVDGACDLRGANSHFRMFWTAADDAAVKRWHGIRVWMNGPFGGLLPIVRRFLQCKAECQLGTSAMFIIPLWVEEDFYKLMRSLPQVFRVVRTWEAGTALFTAPVLSHVGSGRVYRGPTKWAVQAVWAGPEAAIGGLDGYR